MSPGSTESPDPADLAMSLDPPSIVSSPGITMSSSLVTSPAFDVSPGLAASPGTRSPDADRTNIVPIPTISSPTSDSSLSPHNVAGVTPSPPLDTNITATSEMEIETSSDDSLPLDPGHLSPDNEPNQQPPDSLAVEGESLGALGQFPAVVAVETAFNIEGVHGTFISKATIKYWENILGGRKWIQMVQSYLDLERMPPTDSVCDAFTACDRH